MMVTKQQKEFIIAGVSLAATVVFMMSQIWNIKLSKLRYKKIEEENEEV